MPRPLAVALLASVAACWAGEASTPLIDASCADGATLITHWDASIYAKLWNDPALASLHEQVAGRLTELQTSLGFKPLDVLGAMHGGGLHFNGFAPDNGQPTIARLQFEAELGDYAVKVLNVVRAAQSGPGATVAFTLPGAAEALAVPAMHLQLARFANQLVGALNGEAKELRAWKPVPTPNDVQLLIDGTRLVSALRGMFGGNAGELVTTIPMVADFLAALDYRLDLIPEGIHEKLTSRAAPFASMVVDRQLLARLPPSTLIAIAFGFDGAAFWKGMRTVLLAQVARQSGAPSPEAAESMLDQQFAASGLNCTTAQLFSGLRGTLLVAVTPGIPFPAVTIAVPRSPALDQVIGLTVRSLQTLPPAVGQVVALSIPGLPVPAQLGLDQSHWLVSSDLRLANNWFIGKGGGWADSPAGKAALARAPKNASLIAASDTRAVLSTLASFAPLLLGTLDASDRQQAMQALAKASALASSGWLVAYPEGGKAVIEDRGVIGFGALAAALVLGSPAARSERLPVVADEAAAAGILKTQVHRGELEFRKGLYLDQDGDGTGEFAFLSELGGVRPTTNAAVGVLQLVDAQVVAGSSNGYSFAVFLPDAAGGALSDPASAGARPTDRAAAKAQTRHFVAYAWPSAGNGRQFAITEGGQLFSAPASGRPPAWNDLFGGAGWEAAPTWARYQGAHARTDAPEVAPGL